MGLLLCMCDSGSIYDVSCTYTILFSAAVNHMLVHRASPTFSPPGSFVFIFFPIHVQNYVPGHLKRTAPTVYCSIFNLEHELVKETSTERETKADGGTEAWSQLRRQQKSLVFFNVLGFHDVDRKARDN